MPFAADSFDLVICQAAFKNFVHPASALYEMHRVLRSAGTAVIQDMNGEATHADIQQEVKGMELGWLSTFTTQATLEMLKRRAYTPATFERLVAASPFGIGEIQAECMSLGVRLRR
jgi:ubiquinone/menaquinone biosynthesis C-methylase UbiE